MLRPRLITPPATRLLSLADAKEHLRVDGTADGGLIEGYILAAEGHLDGHAGIMGRALITQTWRAEWANWPAYYLALPFPDVQSAAVQYYDADNVLRTLAAEQYRLIEGARGSMLEWDDSFASPSLYSRSDAIRVDMVCGYGDAASDVPTDIIHAVKLLIGAWYENRENTAIGVSVAELPESVNLDGLLYKHRRVGL
jgi:uncharacterized phiE125 gp8 family phage protein